MYKRFAKALAVLSLLGLLALAAHFGLFEHLSDRNWVAGYVSDNGALAWFALVGAGALYTALGAPRQALAFVFGFTFGSLTGSALALVATLLGCISSFYYARWILRRSLQKRFPRRLEKFESLLEHDTWLKVLMLRLLPVGSNLLTNLAAGTTRLSAPQFFSGSLVGYIPQTLVFAFAGAGIGLSDHWQLIISGGLFVISTGIGAYLYRNRLKSRVDELNLEEMTQR